MELYQFVLNLRVKSSTILSGTGKTVLFITFIEISNNHRTAVNQG